MIDNCSKCICRFCSISEDNDGAEGCGNCFECCCERPITNCNDFYSRNTKKQLYFIMNSGCDDITCGLVELSKEELNFLMEIIRNLNQNSTYGCQPTISIYKVNWNNFKKINLSNNSLNPYDDSFIDRKDIFLINNEYYTYVNEYGRWDMISNSEEIK
jgi:hypothetical protein